MPTVRVTWDGQAVNGLLAVGDLVRSTDPIAVRDISGHTTMLPGYFTSGPFTVTRAVDGDLTFDTWGRSAELVRKQVQLELVDDAGAVTATYRLHRCWPQSYVVAPDLATGGATETLVLAVEGWERVTPTVPALAEQLARERGVEVRRVDLSRVVSKYVGETEKNLREVFDEAERSGAVLLFDESDALFGKRTEVGDAHDRYASLEVAFLLDRIAAHQGPVLVVPAEGDTTDDPEDGEKP